MPEEGAALKDRERRRSSGGDNVGAEMMERGRRPQKSWKGETGC